MAFTHWQTLHNPVEYVAVAVGFSAIQQVTHDT